MCAAGNRSARGDAPPRRGRFAPSPTGDLHVGSASTALLAWLFARSQGAEFLLRVEDLDTARCIPGMEQRQLEDLQWLGLDWDQGPNRDGPCGPFRQSQRAPVYEEAIASLSARDLVYLCDCSRAEVRRAATAPHAGDEGPRYPGSCRTFGMRERRWKRPPALRLRVESGAVEIYDQIQGSLSQDVGFTVGDFVLRRGDGVHAYQLAAVVDDVAMGITDVVRGADLLDSTPRQALLASLLGANPPRWAHVPLILDPDGERLAKRAGGRTIRHHREAGRSPGEVVGALARMLGLADPGSRETISAGELLGTFDPTPLLGRRTCAATPELIDLPPRDPTLLDAQEPFPDQPRSKRTHKSRGERNAKPTICDG